MFAIRAASSLARALHPTSPSSVLGCTRVARARYVVRLVQNSARQTPRQATWTGPISTPHACPPRHPRHHPHVHIRPTHTICRNGPDVTWAPAVRFAVGGRPCLAHGPGGIQRLLGGRGNVRWMSAIGGGGAAKNLSPWKARITVLIGNVAYALSLVEYGTTDMLVLRVAALAGCALTVVYMVLQPSIPLVAVYWNILFCVVLTVQIFLLVRKPADLHFTQDEAMLYAMGFQEFRFTPTQFNALVKAGEWVDFKDGQNLTTQGEKSDYLAMVFSGSAKVVVDGEVVAHLSAGTFVGEMSYLSKRPATATVTAEGDVRVFRWNHGSMDQLLNSDDPTLQMHIQRKITDDIINKITILNTQKDRSRHAEFSSMMEVLLAGTTVSAAQRRAVHEYRLTHDISDEYHEATLERLDWTLTQCALGMKNPPARQNTPTTKSSIVDTVEHTPPVSLGPEV